MKVFCNKAGTYDGCNNCRRNTFDGQPGHVADSIWYKHVRSAGDSCILKCPLGIYVRLTQAVPPERAAGRKQDIWRHI